MFFYLVGGSRVPDGVPSGWDQVRGGAVQCSRVLWKIFPETNLCTTWKNSTAARIVSLVIALSPLSRKALLEFRSEGGACYLNPLLITLQSRSGDSNFKY